MARRSPVDLLGADKRDRLDADVLRGDLSWRQLAAKYAVHEATIRKHAERSGLIRNPTGLKRALVQASMAQPDPADRTHDTTHTQCVPSATSTGRSEIEAAADEDTRDMRLGLGASRIALSLVGRQLKKAYGTNGTDGIDDLDPRAIKTLSESISINVDTIRRIRGLDVGVGIPDVRNLTDEQLEDMRHGRVPR